MNSKISNYPSYHHFESDDCLITVRRPCFNQKKFEQQFRIVNEEKSSGNYFKQTLKFLKAYFNILNIFNIFTIFDVIRKYDCRKNFLADILSGLTVGQLPAGLAYGALTSLNPITGLYTSFFCGLIYVLFGTSRHLSVGTYAVTSLMVFSCISKVEESYSTKLIMSLNLPKTQRPMSTLSDLKYEDRETIKLNIAIALTLWCGIFQVVFCFLRLGNISKYLSQPLLRGFTTGCCIHVFTSQIRHVFGIYNSKRASQRVFKLIFTYLDIFKNIQSINWCAFLISVISITFLITFRTQVNERFRVKLRNFQIPIEIIVIIVGTAITYFSNLEEIYDLKIVGKIPKGLPSPSVPKFQYFLFDVIEDAFVISIIAFASSISIADLYAKKHNYKINSNKELFALGVANIFGSFFRCFVSAGSIARSCVQETSGGKTQIVTVVSSLIVLMVMLWISPLLEFLPKACLGAIIISAILSILKQFKDIPHYYRLDKLDCLTWVITFLGTIILDVDIGLGIGILTVLFFNTYRNQNLKLDVIGHIKDYDIYTDVEKFLAKEFDEVKILRPSLPIMYLNCDHFKSELNKICPINEVHDEPSFNCFSSCFNTHKSEGFINSLETTTDELNQSTGKININKIILDCSLVQFIDESGFKSLIDAMKQYESENITFCLANCNDNLINFFKKTNEYSLIEEKLFLTVRDALLMSTYYQQR